MVLFYPTPCSVHYQRSPLQETKSGEVCASLLLFDDCPLHKPDAAGQTSVCWGWMECPFSCRNIDKRLPLFLHSPIAECERLWAQKPFFNFHRMQVAPFRVALSDQESCPRRDGFGQKRLALGRAPSASAQAGCLFEHVFQPEKDVWRLGCWANIGNVTAQCYSKSPPHIHTRSAWDRFEDSILKSATWPTRLHIVFSFFLPFL
ncbi:hypothetical protein QBC44DRAFT_153403 [Cladorrhinum sp. PSN332]|nr:hypothetical protein QBC44DRAFT_153403 [Cladorrhinum sp. PSN332]